MTETAHDATPFLDAVGVVAPASRTFSLDQWKGRPSIVTIKFEVSREQVEAIERVVMERCSD